MSVTFGLSLSPELPPRLLIRLARLAESLGFSRLWFPDHLLNLNGCPAADPWTIMGAVAVKTRRIEIGTAVSDPHRNHPALLAQKAATLDRLSQGRFVLGLGTGEAMNLEPFGIPWNRPLARLRESIAVLRHLLESSQPLTFDGEFYRLKNARMDLQAHNNRRIPLYLAALGPQALLYAGQMADGWLPVPIPVEDFAAYSAPMLQSAAEAGREPSTLQRVASLAVKWPGQASDPLSLVWPVVLQQSKRGQGPPGGVDFRSVNPCEAESLERYAQGQAGIPEELLGEFCCGPEPEELVKRMRGYVGAGATHFNLNLGPARNLVEFAAKVMPAVSGRPPTITACILHASFGSLERLGMLAWLRRFR